MNKDIIHKHWNPMMSKLLSSKAFCEIEKQIGDYYFPLSEHVFRAFSMSPYEIKVVILGQDPYPRKDHAIGYAFAIPEHENKPFSFRAIEKEVGDELDKGLSLWIEQKVFLLNTALTVKPYAAGSHLKLWEGFTRRIITHISIVNKDCIWVLWGKKAQKFMPYITNESNTILTGPHPASEAYAGGKAGFYGCDHFNIINNILKNKNKSIVTWKKEK